METAANLLAWLGALAFDALCIRTALDARRGGRQRIALAAAVSTLGLQVTAVRVAVVLGFEHRLFTAAMSALFLASGYALWVYAETFLGRQRGPRRVVAWAAVAAGAAMLAADPPMQPRSLTGTQALATAAYILVWTVSVTVPSIRMWRAARAQQPVVRHRLRWVAAAYASLVGLLVFSAVGHAGTNRTVALVVWACGTLLVGPMWAAFRPPGWLKRRWEAEEREAARARLLLERMPAIVWTTDAGLHVTSARGAGLADAGPAEGIIGSHIDLLFPGTGFGDAAAGALTGGPLTVQTAHNGRRWLTRLEPLRGIDGSPAGLLGLTTDETIRTEAQEELGEAQHLAHIGSWTWRIEPRSVRWSDEVYRILGVPDDFTITFQDFFEFVHPDDRDRVYTFTSEVLNSGGGSFEVEYRIFRPDGEERWVRGRGVGFADETGRVTHLRGTIQDITADVHAEQALRDAYEREREAAERLRHLDDLKNSLLAAVSHELRTPLAVVLGLAQTLRMHDFRADPARMDLLLEKIEDNAQRLERLLLDLLDLDRLSRGVVEPRRRPVWLRTLVNRVVGSIDLRGRMIETDVEDEIAYVDVAQAERILENLIVNALKHTPDETRITVRALPIAAGSMLSVEDEGAGVPDELKAAIFDPFRRGATYATGTGIGLSLVAKFAELHGGRAWVEDLPGGGSAFRVVLPNDVEDGPEITSLNGEVRTPTAAEY